MSVCVVGSLTRFFLGWRALLAGLVLTVHPVKKIDSPAEKPIRACVYTHIQVDTSETVQCVCNRFKSVVWEKAVSV